MDRWDVMALAGLVMVGLLERGYTIRPRRAWRKKEGGLTWRPALVMRLRQAASYLMAVRSG